MRNIDSKPSLTKEEIDYLATYLISFTHINENSVNKMVSDHLVYGTKIFINKYEFNSQERSHKLKPMKKFFKNFFENIMTENNFSWAENKNTFYHTLANNDSFQEAIKLFYDIILVNDTLDLTICSNLYWIDKNKKIFSTIGNFLHKVKKENNNSYKDKLFEEINSIVENFNFSIYGNDTVIIPLHSSTDIVYTTAQMIAKKTQWELQELEQQPSTSIKNLSTRLDKLNKLNEKVILIEGIDYTKKVLLVDDNYQSGASINFYSMILKKYYNIDKVFSFCLTKTAKHFNPETGGRYE